MRLFDNFENTWQDFIYLQMSIFNTIEADETPSVLTVVTDPFASLP